MIFSTRMTFEFDKNNITEVHLPLLVQAECEGNKHFPLVRETRRNNGLVQLGFFDADTCWQYEQQWTDSQMATLEYIKSNQEAIVLAAYEYTKHKLYPEHIGYIGYDETSFPELQQVCDLRQALGIHFIGLYREHGADTAYFGLQCDFSGDFEHGTNLIMNKATVLGWEEQMGKDLILKDIDHNEPN